MFTRIVRLSVLCAFCSLIVFSQQSPLPTTSGMREFPILLESNVVAGKTSVGSKVQAKLCVATLVDGTVIPRNAVFSGEVVESVAKTATDPSRLAIRMDSAQWKNGSASIKAYLTAWYYPTMTEAGQSLQYGPTQPANRTWNGEGQYPDPNSKIYRPFPGSSSDQSSGVPDATTSVTSNHRVAMKNVESEQSSDGTITIVSKKSNIKLDRLTMYVLATGDIPQPPVKPASVK
jgi:hypothetical protein